MRCEDVRDEQCEVREDLHTFSFKNPSLKRPQEKLSFPSIVSLKRKIANTRCSWQRWFGGRIGSQSSRRSPHWFLAASIWNSMSLSLCHCSALCLLRVSQYYKQAKYVKNCIDLPLTSTKGLSTAEELLASMPYRKSLLCTLPSLQDAWCIRM